MPSMPPSRDNGAGLLISKLQETGRHGRSPAMRAKKEKARMLIKDKRQDYFLDVEKKK